jgi:hypothetical protein
MKVIPDLFSAYLMKVIPDLFSAYLMKVIPDIFSAYLMKFVNPRSTTALEASMVTITPLRH